MRSIGLDVHKRFAEVAIIEGKGPPVQRRISTTTAALRAFARTLRPDDQLVLEATMNTWAIADLLRESGARVVISNPLRTRAYFTDQGVKVHGTAFPSYEVWRYNPDGTRICSSITEPWRIRWVRLGFSSQRSTCRI